MHQETIIKNPFQSKVLLDPQVIHWYNSNTMRNITTLTQKGQVVIPKEIRDRFGLKTSDKLIFSVKDNEIVIKKAKTPEEVMGMLKTDIVATDEEINKAIEEGFLEQWRKKEERLRREYEEDKKRGKYS